MEANRPRPFNTIGGCAVQEIEVKLAQTF
jgi:hypothetical protein